MGIINVVLIFWIGAIVSYLLGKFSRILRNIFVFLTSLGGLSYFVFLYPNYYGTTLNLGFYTAYIGPISQISFLVGFIAISIGFLSMISGLAEERSDFYYFTTLLLIGAMVLFLHSKDFITLFFAFELVTLSSFFSIWEGDKRGAFKYIVWNVFGAYMLLSGIMVFYGYTHSFIISRFFTIPLSVEIIIFLLMFFGFAVKAALMPFHIWAPDAYKGSPHSFTPLLSGAVSKIGVYGYLIVMFYVFGSIFLGEKILQISLAYLGGITALFGGIYAVMQEDAKRLLAYSSVSQIGYVVAGFALATPLSISAGIFLFTGHAIFETLLFFTIASVAFRTGTTNLNELGGLIKKMPVSFIGLLFGIIALAGIPPTVGFPGKWMLYESLIIQNRVILAPIIFAASITAFLYSFRLVYSVFLGPLPERYKKNREAPYAFTIPIIILLIPLLIFGIFPGYILNFSNSTLSSIGLKGINYGLSYIITPLGKFNAGIVGIVFVAAFVLSFILYIIARRPKRVTQFDNYSAAEVIDYKVNYHYTSEFYKFLGREIAGFLRLRIEVFYNEIASFVGGVGEALRKIFTGDPRDYILYIGIVLLIFIIVYGGKVW